MLEPICSRACFMFGGQTVLVCGGVRDGAAEAAVIRKVAGVLGFFERHFRRSIRCGCSERRDSALKIREMMGMARQNLDHALLYPEHPFVFPGAAAGAGAGAEAGPGAVAGAAARAGAGGAAAPAGLAAQPGQAQQESEKKEAAAEMRAGFRNSLASSIKRYIDENYADAALCAQQIAGHFHVNRRYAASAFKDFCGISVKEYINRLRVRKAAELLRAGRGSIGSVIQSVGIDNETYFFSLFKKRLGTTPREYANSHKLNRPI
jgi:AraC-like DNA-binding protein